MASISLELQPFAVPTGVQIANTAVGKRQDGFRPVGTIPLSSVPKAELAKMCAEFTESVMREAGYGPDYRNVDEDWGTSLPG